ncbi:hypothetical protein FH972_002641 [Carpinus fangiana]|uniref:Uncharacterized protein n=1 Tax=Carpinus fangiana TaxID=176857 RepID=A0A5N6QIL1_9ROSI|nr:hypothetical protein FH972_002641 [Carpinus fangiana]
MSIEALAMAGVDYTESGLWFEEWPEKSSGLEQRPLHLLAEQNSCIEDEKMGGDVMLLANREWTKARIREWAKAVAALMKDR